MTKKKASRRVARISVAQLATKIESETKTGKSPKLGSPSQWKKETLRDLDHVIMPESVPTNALARCAFSLLLAQLEPKGPETRKCEESYVEPQFVCKLVLKLDVTKILFNTNKIVPLTFHGTRSASRKEAKESVCEIIFRTVDLAHFLVFECIDEFIRKFEGMEVDLLRKNSAYWRVAKSRLLVVSTIMESNGAVELSFVVYAQSHTVRVKIRNDGRSKVLQNLSQEFWAQLKWVHSKRSSGLRDLCVKGASLPRRFAGEYSQIKSRPTKEESYPPRQTPLILPTPQMAPELTSQQQSSTSESRPQHRWERRSSLGDKEQGEYELEKARYYKDGAKREPQNRKEIPSQSGYRSRETPSLKPLVFKKITNRETEQRSSFRDSSRPSERRNHRSATPPPAYSRRPVLSASDHRNKTKEEEVARASQSSKERNTLSTGNSNTATATGVKTTTDSSNATATRVSSTSTVPTVSNSIPAPTVTSNSLAVESPKASTNISLRFSPKASTILSLNLRPTITPMFQQQPTKSTSPQSQLSPEMQNAKRPGIPAEPSPLDFQHPSSPQKDLISKVPQKMHLVHQGMPLQNLHYNPSPQGYPYQGVYRSPVQAPSYLGMPRHMPMSHAPAPPPPPLTQYSYRHPHPMYPPSHQVPMPPQIPDHQVGCHMIHGHPAPPYPRIKPEPTSPPQPEDVDMSKPVLQWPYISPQEMKQEIVNPRSPPSPSWVDELPPGNLVSKNPRPPSATTTRPTPKNINPISSPQPHPTRPDVTNNHPSPLSQTNQEKATPPESPKPPTEKIPEQETKKKAAATSAATATSLPPIPAKPKPDLKAAAENRRINSESEPEIPVVNPPSKSTMSESPDIPPDNQPSPTCQSSAVQSEPTEKYPAGQFRTSRKSVSLVPTNAQHCKKAVIVPVIPNASSEGLGETERKGKPSTPNTPLQILQVPTSPTTDGEDDLPIASIVENQHLRKRKLRAEKAIMPATDPPPEQKEAGNGGSKVTKKVRLAEMAKRGKNLAAKSKPISRKIAAAKSKLSNASNRNIENAVQTETPDPTIDNDTDDNDPSPTENNVATEIDVAPPRKDIMEDGDFAEEAPLLSLVTSLINAPTGQIPMPPPEASSWREFVMKMDPKTVARVSLDGAYTVFSTLNGKLFKGTSYPGLKEEKDKLESASYATVRDVLGFNFAGVPP